MSEDTTRADVAEELKKFQGWTSDPQFLGTVWSRRSARWTILEADGSSVLSVSRDRTRSGYMIRFGPNVPHYLIVATCAEATADCLHCGTSCGCNDRDGVMDGEIL
jgi:hypothetical protein